jgi:hypothetical protein
VIHIVIHQVCLMRVGIKFTIIKDLVELFSRWEFFATNNNSGAH